MRNVGLWPHISFLIVILFVARVIPGVQREKLIVTRKQDENDNNKNDGSDNPSRNSLCMLKRHRALQFYFLHKFCL